MKKALALLLVLSMVLCIAPIQGLAQTPITPQEMAEKMGMAINMGNTLEAPDFEGNWAKAAEEYYFDDYKAAGFKAVRIPVRWGNERTQAQAPYTIDTKFMDRVEQVVDWSLAKGLVTVIDTHHEDWLKNDYENNIEKFEKMWEQIAERFKGKSENLLFEIFNEPTANMTDSQVNDLNKRILKIIRAKNPTRIVVIGGGAYNNWIKMINAMEIPKDPYLMATFHYYDPYEFTHELKGTWGSESDMKNIARIFDVVKNWSVKNNIPVFLGEYGVRCETPDRAARIKWYDFISDQALSHGFPFAVWDDGGWFQLYDRTARTYDTDILKAIQNKGNFPEFPPLPTPTPAPSVTPEAGEKVFEDFESEMTWASYAGAGAAIDVKFVEGNPGKAAEVTYSSGGSGYWGFTKDINEDWSRWLKLSFDLKDTTQNDIRVLLVEKGVEDGQEGESWAWSFKPGNAWTHYEIPFSAFTKRGDYQPPAEDMSFTLDLQKLKAIHFSFANGKSGVFTVDNVKLLGIPKPAIGEEILENFEGDMSWGTYSGAGASIKSNIVEGASGNAMEVSYTNPASGYWGVAKEISTGWSKWKKVAFDIKSADTNEIRVMLIENSVEGNQDGENWEFVVKPAESWRTIEIPFSEFKKRGDYQPSGEDMSFTLDLDKLKSMHFTFSSAKSGTFAVDNIRLIGLPEVKVQAFNSDTANSINSIYPRIKVINTGKSAVNLDDIKIRYYFTADSGMDQSFWCDYAAIVAPAANKDVRAAVSGSFVKMQTAKPTADTYLEIQIAKGAGSIVPGQALEVAGRFANSNWSNFTQTNDYSFNQAPHTYVDWNRITVYCSGELILGMEP